MGGKYSESREKGQIMLQSDKSIQGGKKSMILIQQPSSFAKVQNKWDYEILSMRT